MGRRPGTQASSEALERRQALGLAVRRARQPMNQTEFGERLGPHLGGPIPQVTISRWERGQVEMTLEQVRAIETVLGLELGTLAKAAAYA